MRRAPLAAVVATLELTPSSEALARATELDREARRCESEAAEAEARGWGQESWLRRARELRGEALRALREEGE